jgi:plasmid stabilization system protein ParE
VDIESHYEYLMRRDMNAADDFLDATFDKFVQLTRHPEMGQIRTELGEGVRCVSQSSYVIFDCIAVSDIIVLRVLHGSQDVNMAFNTTS